jgi:hypothetical protein
MRRARKFLALPWSDKWLLIEALLVVGATRLGLWLVPFRALPGRLELFARLAAKAEVTDLSPDRIAWTVGVVSSYIPAATCLTQALAAKVLLGWRGWPSQLRIGVAKGARGQLEAHAWLECQGRILIGGSAESVAHFTALPSLASEQS